MTEGVVSVPLCPDCLGELVMLDRFWFAPSVAWCSGCFATCDVEFDHNAERWFVLEVTPFAASVLSKARR